MKRARKYSFIILTLVLALTAFFAFHIPNLRFDHSLESFFPSNDPQTDLFYQFRTMFGNDNDFVLIGVVNEQGIFQQDFLHKIDSLSQQLEGLEHVNFVLSPTNVSSFRRRALSFQPQKRRYLRWDSPNKYADSARIFQSAHLPGFLFSEHRPAVAIFLKHEDLLSPQRSKRLSRAIREQVDHFDFDEVHIAGRILGQSLFIKMLRNELLVFISAVLFLIILILFMIYRSTWGIYMPLLVVGLSLLWSMGMIGLQDVPLDIVSNIIPPILLVIGLSDVVHLLTHYLSKLDQGKDRLTAFISSAKTVGLATFITSTTTAIGFLTFLGSSFSSMVNLGLFTAIGILFAFILSYAFLGPLLIFHPRIQSNNSPLYARLDFFSHVLPWIRAKGNYILLGSFCIIVFGAWGIQNLSVNKFILEDLDEDHPFRQHFAFFASNFGGVRPFELMVSVGDENKHIWERDVLTEIAAVDSFLQDEYGVKQLFSPYQLIREANQYYHFGSKRHDRLPNSDSLLKELSMNLDLLNHEVSVPNLYSEDLKTARITGRIPDWGSKKVNEKNRVFQAFLTTRFPQSSLRFDITGTAHLMDLNHQYMVQHVGKGLVIALISISLIMGLLLRSFHLVWISLIPNLVPLFFIAGIMALLGIELSLFTTIVFVIAFGIAVDDSIHFLSRFRLEIQQFPIEEAVQRSLTGTGKAIFLTTLILCGGFLVLCFSDFQGTFYMGLLISLSLCMALLSDLILLPILLLRFYRKP